MKLSFYAAAILALSVPASAISQSDSVYILCDDKSENPTRIGLVLNEANNSVGITEHRMKVANISAISFGPNEVKFTARFVTGAIDIFTVSRIDASISRYTPLLDSTWQYEGCGVVAAPAERAF